MRLKEAKQQTEHAKDQLNQAQRQLEAASQLVGAGEQHTPMDLERMDAARIAAWEEIAVWQANKENASLTRTSDIAVGRTPSEDTAVCSSPSTISTSSRPRWPRQDSVSSEHASLVYGSPMDSPGAASRHRAARCRTTGRW